MSNCIKDLFDYDLVKKCLKCGNISLKSNFHKNKNMRDGLYTHCKNCVNQKQKQYDIKTRDKKKNTIKIIVIKFTLERMIIIYKIEIELSIEIKIID